MVEKQNNWTEKLHMRAKSALNTLKKDILGFFVVNKTESLDEIKNKNNVVKQTKDSLQDVKNDIWENSPIINETNKKIIEEIKWWKFDNSRLLTELTIEDAQILFWEINKLVDANKNKKIKNKTELDLSGISDLKKDVAEILIENYCDTVNLSWIREVDEDTASCLRRYLSNILVLNWVSNINDEPAVQLSKFKWECIKLNWLVSLSEFVSEDFSDFLWQELHLDWLTEISEEAAQFLAMFKGSYLSLSWVKTISRKALDYLLSYKGNLSMIRLREITT